MSKMINHVAAALLGGVLAIPFAHGAPTPLVPQRYGDFDRYVLALSWQTGFCQEQHDHNRQETDECRLQKEQDDKRAFLTVHGLWPGLPKSIAARGVDEKRWMRYGCATRPVPNMPEARVGKKCDAAQTGLSLEAAARLSSVMPAAGGTSCLERYEFAKHGVCFGFDPDAYFTTMVRMNTEVKQSPLGEFIAANYGKDVSRKAFDNAVAKAFGKQNIQAFTLICSGNPAYLTEMQISLNAATINAPLNAASFAPQPHPGNCGKQFRLDDVGYW
nr:ribonuclease I [Atlantibacter sp.]